MNKESLLIILWMIFGFVFIIAAEAILYFFIFLLYVGFAELGVSYSLMSYLFPVLTLMLYLLTAFSLVKRAETKVAGISLTQFPKKLLIILSLVIIVLLPVTHKLSGMYAEATFEDAPMTSGEYLSFYGWFNLGFAVAQIVTLIAIVWFSLSKLKEWQNN